MDDQRAQQQAENPGEAGEKPADPAAAVPSNASNEEALLQRALAMSMDTMEGEEAGPAAKSPARDLARDLASTTEEDQIAINMRMSMVDMPVEDSPKEESMEGDDKDADYSEVMNDPAFLQSDPQSDAVRSAMGAIQDDKDKKDKAKETDEEK